MLFMNATWYPVVIQGKRRPVTSPSMAIRHRFRLPQVGDRKLCSTRHENSSLDRKYGYTNIADIVRRPNFSPGVWSRAADAIIYKHPFSQTGITFRSVIGIA
ncbi:hypothetical protein Taro_038557 [Colocasia esculenta]|uniref:Uncharacterized protein n=1 Tax=Colocasia esculenta TaxID=4460 RepID=A0A843WT06_COLES|nr:hypothetical protein [Colocasia esculenta]